ncbi:MAG TPA: hypothetical protein VFU63_02880 [Ktedonobacterales bacterium]|nr:hypothetical protein [Ktedonobacterales bacterium]
MQCRRSATVSWRLAAMLDVLEDEESEMTNEPQSSQMNDIPVDDAADAAAVQTIAATPMDTTERFRQGAAMQALYAQMRPDQRTAIAGEFIRLLELAGDDHVEQFRGPFQQHTQLADDPAADELLSADAVAAVDRYVRERHPEMIAPMLEHPVTQSALKSSEVLLSNERDELADGDKIMPTENVATSGAAYGSAWMMMELDGEEANRLVEDPHEQGVEPSGEFEREQRAIENEGEEGERRSLDPLEHNF